MASGRTGRRWGAVALVGALASPRRGAHPSAGRPRPIPQPQLPETAVGVSATATVTVSNVATSGALTIEGTVVTGAARRDFHDDVDDSRAIVLQPGEARWSRHVPSE